MLIIDSPIEWWGVLRYRFSTANYFYWTIVSYVLDQVKPNVRWIKSGSENFVSRYFFLIIPCFSRLHQWRRVQHCQFRSQSGFATGKRNHNQLPGTVCPAMFQTTVQQSPLLTYQSRVKGGILFPVICGRQWKMFEKRAPIYALWFSGTVGGNFLC